MLLRVGARPQGHCSVLGDSRLIMHFSSVFTSIRIDVRNDSTKIAIDTSDLQRLKPQIPNHKRTIQHDDAVLPRQYSPTHKLGTRLHKRPALCISESAMWGRQASSGK
eukprot:652794-Pleurochrysis_carterae.AAC.6